MLKPCEECGKDFEPKSKVSRFCSDRCRYAARDRKRMVPCSICGEPMHLGGDSRHLPADQRAHNKCRHGAAPEHGARGYSKGCRCQVCKAGVAERQRKRYLAQREQGVPRKRHYRTHHKVCPECATPFTTRYKQTRLCSSACGAREAGRARSDELRLRRLPALYTGPAYVPPVPHVATSHRLVSGECRACGDWFVSEYRDVTCSPACAEVERKAAKARARAKRRALKRDAYVADVYRLKVYEADGYRCHLCGRMTDKTKQAPHPKAPTIDHIIPLAVGGTHEPLNCRTAHFECNSRKSHRGEGEQLLLIAY